MRRLKPKKTNVIKVFKLDFIALAVVLFVLLVVCAISRPAMFGSVRLELPRGEANVIVLEQEPITVSLKRNEEIYLGNENIKLNSLPRRLLELSNDNLDAKIFVKADKELSLDKIIKVISAINSKGFGDVSLIIDISKNL